MKTGIVFEGGAFRTIFSCGVMDAFLENDIMPDYIIGVSAGAAYGVSYAARQYGRNFRLITEFSTDKRYMGVNNLFIKNNRSYFNLDFAYNKLPNELLPFDYEGFKKFNGEFYAVVTNVLTGKAEYMAYDPLIDTKNLILEATCALPVLFPCIEINNIPYLDGGLSDSIPFKKAFEDGCDRVVVVLTREEGYQKRTGKGDKLIAEAYLKYPEIAKDIMKRAKRYNKTLAELKKYEEEGKVIVIRPDDTKNFKRTEKNKEKLNALYTDGYEKGIDYAKKVIEFFK